MWTKKPSNGKGWNAVKVLVDTNVILDVLCNRKEFVAASLRVFQCCETQHITGYISALSIPNIVYIMRKELDPEQVKEILHTLTMVFLWWSCGRATC